MLESFTSSSPEAREAIAKDLFKALTAHERMEDEHFYPALEAVAGDNHAVSDLAGSMGDQTKIEMEVTAIRAMAFVTGESEERIKKMMNKVLAHAEKEERVILPKAEELLSAEQLEELGELMEPDSAVATARE